MRDLAQTRIATLMAHVSWRVSAVLALCLGVGVWLAWSGAPEVMVRSVPLVVLAIGFWALNAMQEALTGLLFLLGATVFAGVAPDVVFSGFSTSAFWLVFTGAVLSSAVSQSGLSRWLVGRFLARSFAGASYGFQVAMVVGIAAALGLLLPATVARVAVLVPLIMALSERVGHQVGGRGCTGLVLAAAIGTYVVPISYLPANLPNMVLVGSLESIHGVVLSFGEYLLMLFPPVGFVKGAVLVVLITQMFRAAPTPDVSNDANEEEALSDPARRLLVVLLATLTLWGLDGYHGISPAWVGLGAAVICLLPVMRILDLSDLPHKTLFPVLLYVAAVLGLGAVMTDVGAGTALAQALLGALPLVESGDFGRLTLLMLGATVLSLATTVPVAPAITAPFFGEIAQSIGWSTEQVGLSQVLGYATPLLPYQVPPFVLALTLSGVAVREAARVLIWLAVLTTPITLICTHLWWQMLS